MFCDSRLTPLLMQYWQNSQNVLQRLAFYSRSDQLLVNGLYPKPSCWQATFAAISVMPSSHTVPQAPL